MTVTQPTRNPEEWIGYLEENPDISLMVVDSEQAIHEFEYDEHLGHVTFLAYGSRGYDRSGTRAALKSSIDALLKPVPREEVRAERERLVDGEYETLEEWYENRLIPEEREPGAEREVSR